MRAPYLVFDFASLGVHLLGSYGATSRVLPLLP